MQLVRNCCEAILNEFKIKNFGFEHQPAEEFYQSQWQSHDRSFLYLIYRWISATFFIGVFIASLVLQFSDGKFFIFLTNWGIILCTGAQLIAAILVTKWHFNIGNVRAKIAISSNTPPPIVVVVEKTPFLVKIYWLLHVVSLSLALIITTVYWIFLHGKMNKPVRFPIMSFITHCLNSVFMLVDFFIVAFPVRILHTIYAMLLPIGYCFFTVVYFLFNGEDEYGNLYVYPILDWLYPVRGITTFTGVFILYLIYGLILFGLYHVKRAIGRAMNIVWSPHQIVGLA